MDKYVDTNMGKMPIEDYLEIQAMQFGFDGYEELYREGYRIDGYEKIHPDMLKENCMKERKNVKTDIAR